MYKIYINDTLIYTPYFNNRTVSQAKAELVQNDIHTFDVTLEADNLFINQIRKLKDTIDVYDDEKLMFRGLVVDEIIGFRKTKKLKCKSNEYHLTQSIVRPYEFQGTVRNYLLMLIDSHNAQNEFKIRLGDVTVTDPNEYIVRSNKNYPNVWEEIKNKLISPLGGYIQLRYSGNEVFIDYLKDFTKQSNQVIEYSKNLTDLERETSALDIATVLIPLGAQIQKETQDGATSADSERLTIKEVNEGYDYVKDDAAVSRYGWIEKVETWDDVTVASNLLTKARARLKKLIDPTSNIVVEAVDLAHSDSSISSFKLGEYIHVKSKFHQFDSSYLPMKISIDLFNVSNNKIQLNETVKGLTDYQISQEYDVKEIINNTKVNVLEQADSRIRSQETKMTSLIEQTGENIKSELKKELVSKTDNDAIISTLESKITQNTGAISLQTSRTNKLADSVSELNKTKANASDLTETSDKVNALDSTVSGLDTAVTNLDKSKADASDLSATKNKVTDLTNAVNTKANKADLDTANNNITSLADSVNDLSETKADASDVKNDIDNVNKSITDARDDLGQDITDTRNEFTNEISRLDIDLTKIRSDIESVHSQLIGTLGVLKDIKQLVLASKTNASSPFSIENEMLRMGFVGATTFEFYKAENFNGSYDISKTYSASLSIYCEKDEKHSVTVKIGSKTETVQVTNQPKDVIINGLSFSGNQNITFTSSDTFYLLVPRIKIVEGADYSEMTDGIVSMNSQIEQNSATLKFIAQKIEEQRNRLTDQVTSLNQLKKYVIINDDNESEASIMLCTSTLADGTPNGFYSKWTNSGLYFYQNYGDKEPIAYFTNNELRIIRSVVVESLRIGSHVWVTDKNKDGKDILVLKYIGGKK